MKKIILYFSVILASLLVSCDMSSETKNKKTDDDYLILRMKEKEFAEEKAHEQDSTQTGDTKDYSLQKNKKHHLHYSHADHYSHYSSR